jgi:holo-[acyl-carrier protein] synthase
MILGTGLDLTELGRIRAALERQPERFPRRILHDSERAAMPRLPVAWLAARFAAKEAAAKALGTGFTGGVAFRDIEVYKELSGKPCLRFHGAAFEHAQKMGVKKIHLSLTHGRDTAAAVVILEG